MASDQWLTGVGSVNPAYGLSEELTLCYSPLDSKEIKAVNPKEISPKYSLERLTLKPKLQNFGHLMQETTH